MKFLFLTQYYPPEHGAPQNRLHDLARRWVMAGHEVTVLSAMPNYPRGEVFPEYRGRFTMSEEIDGVRVIRSAIFATKKKGIIPQLISYFSFVFSSIIVGLIRLGKHDVLLCESPPLFIGFSALILKFRTRAKLIMNISDLWPESAVQLGMLKPGPALSILEWFEGLLYRSSHLVSCQTNGIEDGVLTRAPGSKTFLFPNGVDLDMFPVLDKDKELARNLGLDLDRFIIGYGGNHGRSQALSQVLKAAEKLGKPNDFQFVLIGDGPEKEELISYAKEKNLANIVFLPSQPRQEMAKLQALWDVALVPLKNIDLFDGARPSKMFELMAGKIPFIFCGKGEGADIALKSGCAEVVPPENSDSLAAKIAELAKLDKAALKKRGETGRKFVENHYNRARLANEFLDLIKSI